MPGDTNKELKTTVAVPLPQATATPHQKVSREPYPGHLDCNRVRQENQGGIDMANMKGFDKIQDMYVYAEYIGKQDDFVSFLRYCAERLQQGASVEEIWNDWRAQE